MNDASFRDYDYVAWHGDTPYAAVPASSPAPVVIDATEVWMTSERELRYWTCELRATVYELREAIEIVGSRSAAKVRAWLEGDRAPSVWDVPAT